MLPEPNCASIVYEVRATLRPSGNRRLEPAPEACIKPGGDSVVDDLGLIVMDLTVMREDEHEPGGVMAAG